MIIHALRVAAVLRSSRARIGGCRSPDEDIAVLCRSNRASDLPSVEHSVVHGTHSCRGVHIAHVLDICGDAGPAGGIRVERMCAVDEDAHDATELAKHVCTADDLFAGKREAETDDVDKVALEDAGMLEIVLGLLLGHQGGARALAFNLLQLLAALALLLRGGALLRLLCGLLGVDLRKLEVLLDVRGAAGRAAG